VVGVVGFIMLAGTNTLHLTPKAKGRNGKWLIQYVCHVARRIQYRIIRMIQVDHSVRNAQVLSIKQSASRF
jgi:hypothetical protein